MSDKTEKIIKIFIALIIFITMISKVDFKDMFNGFERTRNYVSQIDK